MVFRQVLALSDEATEPRPLQLVLIDESPNAAGWRVSSRDSEHDDHWVEHAGGRITRASGPADDGTGPGFAEAHARMRDEVDGATLYDALDRTGLQYGPRFRRVERLWWADDEFVARLTDGGTTQPDAFNLDACLHGLAWLGCRHDEPARVPVSVERVAIAADAGAPAWVHGVRTRAGDASTADLVVWDLAGRVVARIVGLRALSPDRADAALPAQGRWLHGQAWVEQPLLADPKAEPRDWLVVAACRDASAAWLERLQVRLGDATRLRWAPGDGTPFPMVELRAWVESGSRRARSIVWIGDSVERAARRRRWWRAGHPGEHRCARRRAGRPCCMRRPRGSAPELRVGWHAGRCRSGYAGPRSARRCRSLGVGARAFGGACGLGRTLHRSRSGRDAHASGAAGR